MKKPKSLTKGSRKTRAAFRWGKEEKRAREDIRQGRVRKFRSAKEALKWLKS